MAKDDKFIILYCKFEIAFPLKYIKKMKATCFPCLGKKKKKPYEFTRLQLQNQYQKEWRFNEEELFEFTKRFESYAINHRLSHKNYRESLGIIGIESLSFLCDRMFKVMDKNNTGYV